MSTSLRVATVQLASENGDVEGNLARATPLCEEAARRGARLVLLPEFMPCGYRFTEEIWDAAEPVEGPTVRWLRRVARRLDLYLGTSFLEADGEDFYNTFVLATPEGDEAGRVRKRRPAAFEAFFTRGHQGPHVLQTALGRIGVGICYENQLAFLPGQLCDEGVELLLMPHSAPALVRGPLLPRRVAREFTEVLERTPAHYARLLGVPVLYANKCGPWSTPLPLLPGRLLAQDSAFPGRSCVIDGDGRLLGRLGPEPGVLVGEVSLDPGRRRRPTATPRGHWAFEMYWLAHLFRIVEAVGSAAYRRSDRRRRRALAVSGARQPT